MRVGTYIAFGEYQVFAPSCQHPCDDHQIRVLNLPLRGCNVHRRDLCTGDKLRIARLLLGASTSLNSVAALAELLCPACEVQSSNIR